MQQKSKVFVRLDTSKLKISVAVADGERAFQVITQALVSRHNS
jgi:hypothetical protein